VTGFLFLNIVSGSRRFQGVGATVPITAFSGNPSYPASVSSQNPPDSSSHSLDLVLVNDITGKLVAILHD
jgi:hypothetical protein